MSRADDYAASLDPRVAAQVTASIYHYFFNTVGTEGTAAPNHAARETFGNQIVQQRLPIGPYVLSVCAFASTNAATPDATIDNAVATLWNTWAGVS